MNTKHERKKQPNHPLDVGATVPTGAHFFRTTVAPAHAHTYMPWRMAVLASSWLRRALVQQSWGQYTHLRTHTLICTCRTRHAKDTQRCWNSTSSVLTLPHPSTQLHNLYNTMLWSTVSLPFDLWVLVSLLWLNNDLVLILQAADCYKSSLLLEPRVCLNCVKQSSLVFVFDNFLI